MSRLLKINLLLLILLSVATGLVKIGGMEEEMVLFRKIGFTDGFTVLFGVIQLVAGVALISPASRRVGAGVLLPTFAIATYALFVSSVYPFAPLSLVFMVMASVPLLEKVTPVPARSPI